MSCCKCECEYLSIIIGIIAGILLGVLCALGFVSTGIIFWVYLGIGVLGVLLSPIYALLSQKPCMERCFCAKRALFFAGAVGAIITAAVGLIIAGIASTTVIAIVLGLSTFFSVILVIATICITNCICGN